MSLVTVREFDDPAALVAHYRAVKQRIFAARTPVALPPPAKSAAPPEPPKPPSVMFGPPAPAGGPNSPARADWIIAFIANAHDVSIDEIMGDRRTRVVTTARQAVMVALVLSMPRWSIARIADRMGRDHTTVLHALNRARTPHHRQVQRPRANWLPQETLVAMCTRREAGETIKTISEALGLRPSAVGKRLLRMGIMAPPRPGHDRDGKFLPKLSPLFQRGLNTADIAAQERIPEAEVLRRLVWERRPPAHAAKAVAEYLGQFEIEARRIG